MIEAHATAKYVRTSAQKAGLVLDLIRGHDVNQALARLTYAQKGVARDVAKVLRSAIANAQQKEGFGGDVDRLFVKACYANQGPSMKRVRPAPMGRAFRVVKRTAHLTVEVAERSEPDAVVALPASEAPAPGAGRAKPASAARSQAKKAKKAKDKKPTKAAKAAKRRPRATSAGARKKAPAKKGTTGKG
jgi:large subunit ribosomal protein L22